MRLKVVVYVADRVSSAESGDAAFCEEQCHWSINEKVKNFAS